MNDIIAIALATYNGGKYISAQLESIFNQTYQNFRLYIHDDGSTDETLLVIQSYIERYPTKIVLLDYESSKDAKKNFMSILRHISNQYVMLCDQDDVWNNNKIELTYNRMRIAEKSNPEKGILVFGDQVIVDKRLNIIKDSYIHSKVNDATIFMNFEYALLYNETCGCTMMVNRTILDFVLKCKNEDNIVMHDDWIFLVASAFGVLEYIDEPLMLYRMHESNTCGGIKDPFLIRLKQHFNIINETSVRKWINSKQTWLDYRIIQAKELMKIGIPFKGQEICSEFVNIKKKNPIRRRIFYIKNNMVHKRLFIKLMLWG